MKKSSIAAGLVATISVIGFSGAPAHAVTLMELLRGGPGNSGGASRSAGAEKPIFGGSRDEIEGAMSDPDPLPKISGPRYNTYKADSLRQIKSTSFAPQVSIDVKPADPTAEAQPATHDPRRAMAEVKVFATDDIANVVEDYYGALKPLVWVSNGEVSEKAKAMIAALAQADTVGLDPADYQVVPPSLSADEPQEARDRALMKFELALSVKALTYVQDTERGRIDPNRISGYYDFKRKTVNLKPVLSMLRMSPDVTAFVRSRDPQDRVFQAMKAELQMLRETTKADETRIEIAAGTLLKPGQNNAELSNIIEAVKRRGSESLKLTHAATLDGYQQGPEYTPDLVSVMEDFQKESGLKPDGVIGQATIRKLTGESQENKIDKLIVAMEARRWLPEDLGARYVFINQPAFRVYYFEEGTQKLDMRVVVGSKSNQTYFFQDQIETVEFNPYWGVPQSIIVNEMLPKLRQDPSYLDRLGYEVSYGGRKVASAQVNWNTNPNVDVRQPPGGDNALGELKILFPNAHAIYMHDTPSKSFFQRDMRALSHGCVRLQDPRAMAAAVMGTSVPEIAKQIASGQNRAVSVPQKIPVYVSYFTAWPNKDGKIEYFADIYDRDSYTMKAFAATSAARAVQS